MKSVQAVLCRQPASARWLPKKTHGSRHANNRGKQFPKVSYARLPGPACKSQWTAKASTARDMLATGALNRSLVEATRLMSLRQSETNQACRAPAILAANPGPWGGPLRSFDRWHVLKREKEILVNTKTQPWSAWFDWLPDRDPMAVPPMIRLGDIVETDLVIRPQKIGATSHSAYIPSHVWEVVDGESFMTTPPEPVLATHMVGSRFRIWLGEGGINEAMISHLTALVVEGDVNERVPQEALNQQEMVIGTMKGDQQ